ncbi:MAG: LysR family transcriptional regulator [Luteolibacter sp.]
MKPPFTSPDESFLPNLPDEFPSAPSIAFRHLNVFKQVYLEKSYASAALSLGANRKSIIRSIQQLEQSFDCLLFKEIPHGELVPTPFAERLYNDLRFLHGAQCRLHDHTQQIHDTGRIVHIGSPPSVFRTTAFRNLFREIQSFRGIRLSYVTVHTEDAARSLLAGHCDVFIGPKISQSRRYAAVPAGIIPFHLYCLLPATGPSPMSYDRFGTMHLLRLEGVPHSLSLTDGGREWLPLSEKQWLRWLDHPKECPQDALICAPDTHVDPNVWQSAETSWTGPVRMELYASFPRQHPYEFLPALAGQIKAFSSLS